MGQQVPFETLDLVARGLAETAQERSSGAAQDLSAGYVRLPQKDGSDETLPRVKITLPDSREVYLFEAYWAPITEGKVKTLDVLSFLITAGCNGIASAFVGEWQRWMFGGLHSFTIPWTLVFPFLGAFAVVGALVVANVLTIAVALSKLLSIAFPLAWPGEALYRDLTIDLALFVLAALGVGAGLKGIPWTLRRIHGLGRWIHYLRTGRSAAPRDTTWRLHPAWATLCWLLIFVSLAIGVADGFLMILHLLWGYGNPPRSPFELWSGSGADTLAFWDGVALPLWVLLFWLTRVARRLFVQFLGDVSAYVSAYQLSEYWELRTRIKDESAKVARAVYGAVTPDRKAVFGRVVVAGHSLGSIIAYDTLNQLLREDATAKPSQKLRVAERTPLLLTFGSPLDKTAFVFTAQKAKEAEVREALAAATQPLIVDYKHRPGRWVNIWSRSDWIGGSLEFYDNPDQKSEGDQKRVCNCEDPEATTPILAHNEYWANTRLRDALYDALTTDGLLDCPSNCRCA